MKDTAWKSSAYVRGYYYSVSEKMRWDSVDRMQLAFVHLVMNFRVPCNAGHSLLSDELLRYDVIRPSVRQSKCLCICECVMWGHCMYIVCIVCTKLYVRYCMYCMYEFVCTILYIRNFMYDNVGI